MSYQVFARKYRPLTFDDVLGQDHVVQTLKNAIGQNRLAHAYLFVGPRGTGKTSTARIFAKALNCSSGPRIDFDPHEDICEEIAEGRSLDVLEIDGASNRGIDHIRDLRDNVRFAPSRGNFRIVYIDEVHMLTKESFNALLKTLEEPPPHVKFIFATTEPHKILPTILSRCQRFDLRPIPTDTIAGHLLHIASQEGVTLSREAAFAVAKVADGGMRDAQSMLDQLVSFCGDKIEEEQVLHIFGITSRETVARALSMILNKELPSLLHLLHEQAEAGRDMGQLLSEIISAVREILVARVDPEAGFDALPEATREELAALVKRTQTDKILRLVEVLAETEDKMRWSTNKRLHLEMGLIKAVHALMEASISDIIMALEGAPLPIPSKPVMEPVQAPLAQPAVQPTPAPRPQEPEAVSAAPVPAADEHDLMDPVPDFPGTEEAPSPTPQDDPETFTQPETEPSPVEDPLPPVGQEPESAPEAMTQSVAQPEPVATLQPSPGFETSSAPVQAADEHDLTVTTPDESLPSAEPDMPDMKPDEIPFMQDFPSEPSPEHMETPACLNSALSDIPASPSDSTEPTFMDPEEGLPPNKRTISFFDNLFGASSGSDRAPSPAPMDSETQPLPPVSSRQLSKEDWKTVTEQAASQFPLQADFLAGGIFAGHDGMFVTLAFHPSDRQGMDSLNPGTLRTALEAALSDLAGNPVTITVKQDESVPEPVQEQLAPLPVPAPPPAAAPAPKPQAQVKTRANAPATQPAATQEPSENDYYSDPLIDAAMEIFRARIISQ